MPITLMYITNNPDVAVIAQRYGVDRIWIDLETLGKEERQKGLDSVKSHHCIDDIKKVSSVLTTSQTLVRVNPVNPASGEEIERVISAGADVVMLPMWKTPDEVREFLNFTKKRVKTVLLLETKEAVECVDTVLANGGFDEIHIGLNDLHLSYGLTFMFELLSNGTVESLCKKFKAVGVPYGFGGIAKIGQGDLPAEKILTEHYRLGSTRAILSRSFCDAGKISNIDEIETSFKENMGKLRAYEEIVSKFTEERFAENKSEVAEIVKRITAKITEKRNANRL